MHGEAKHLSTEDWVERLHNDVLDVPAEEAEDAFGAVDGAGFDRINYATLEFELERTRKRLAIWDIFLGHMKAGAETWDEIRHSLTAADLEQITDICDGVPLRDVLLDMD
jgi:hypothetical protein